MSTISFSGAVVTAYDAIQGPTYFEPYAIETAARLAKFNPQKVLETACGTGRVTNHLCKVLSPHASLTASDISSDMMAVARKKLSSVKNISWIEADAQNLPFADETFDAVVCQFGLMFFPDKKKGLNEAWRVLKNGGIIIVATWSKLERNELAAAGRNILKEFFDNSPPADMNLAFRMHNKKDIQDLFTECRFTNIQIETVVKTSVAESATELAKALIEGSTIRNFIIQKDASAFPMLKQKIESVIIANFGDHPVKGKMEALYTTAQKGSDSI
jgi:ubiquinone/menaquinone biosynthesis C-methylase UbiE